MPSGRENAWDRLSERPAAVPSAPAFGAGRPASKRQRRVAALLIALAVSAAFHVVVFGGAVVWQLLHAPKPEDTPLEIEMVDAKNFPNFVMPKIQAPPAAGAQAAPTPPLDSKGQIVALAHDDDSANAPKSARFLSDENHVANQETASRNTAVAPKVLADAFKGLGDDPKTGDGTAQGTSAGKGERLGNDAKTEDATRGKADGAPDPKDHTLTLADDEFGIRAHPLPTPEGGPEGDSDHDAHTVAAGAGTKVAMAGAPNNDYLPGVRIGDKTVLNAKKDFFASFWLRVQQQVDPFWVREVNHADPAGLQKRDYFTRANVTLAADGSLVAVDITQSCGVPGWDRAVIDAFQQAAPFLHPPAGLVDPDGKIRMDDLGFIVSLTGGQMVHMYADPREGKLFPGIGEGVPMR